MNGIYNFTLKEAEKIYFTSDLHFFHKNIMKYCPAYRNYDDVEAMNEGIVSEWNKAVPKDAIVFILGDISLGGKDKKIIELLERMNGKKYLCLGNHDSMFTAETPLGAQFEDVQNQYYLRIAGQKVVLNHYPFENWRNGGTENGIQLFGHIHSEGIGCSPIVKSCDQLDCGWDNHGKPINFFEAINLLKAKRCEDKFLNAFVTIGLPGIGKSTYCSEHYPDCASISRDKIRAELGFSSSEDEKKVLGHEQEYEVTMRQLKHIRTLSSEKKNLVIDDTNLNRNFRQALIQNLRDNGYRINYIIFDPQNEVNIELCKKRREGQIPENVISSMATKYEEPGIMEWDTITYVR